MRVRIRALPLVLALSPLATACSSESVNANAAATERLVDVTVATQQGPRTFRVEVASTAEAQDRGLMFRTDIPQDGGMLFYPYPGDGGPPRESGIWMKNTPTALDIIFIREDRTIARIAENAVPFDETILRSGEPVAAVLEVHAGKSAELGIAAGDKVSWGGL